MPIQTGTKIGAYEVREFLGQGAMGMVYKAYHADLARTAAVKVLHLIEPDVDTSARFRREAQAIAALRHPNILNVYDFGRHEGATYMIVEYMPGGSLADRARSGPPLTRESALDRLDEIAAALDYAHASGIVHRDVKPANVLIAGNGSAVLADFGLVKLMQSMSVKTMSGVTTGTPAYMAPEQVTGSNVGPPADVYAFTTMAYEYLTGAVPFEGEGMLELLYAHVHREPPKASSRNAELSVTVDAVLDRGLRKDPASRWPTCAALMEALRAGLRGEPVELDGSVAARNPVISSAAADPLERTLVMAPAVPVMPLPRASRSPRRRWLAAGGFMVVLIVALGAAGLSLIGGRYSVSLSASSVAAGESVAFTGRGFKAGDSISVLIASARPTLLASLEADAAGAVTGKVSLPEGIASGRHELRLCDRAGRCASAPVTITPSPQPTPAATPTATPTAVMGGNGSFTINLLSPTGTLIVYANLDVVGKGFAPGKIAIVFVRSGISYPVADLDSPDGSFHYVGDSGQTFPRQFNPGPGVLRVCNGPLPGVNCKDQPLTLTRQ